jgi:Domain of unknown function (DUF4868)
MTAPVPALPALLTEGDMTLAVGWRSGPKTKLRRVNMTQGVEVELRIVATAVAADLETREVGQWSPEVVSSPEVVHVLPIGDVGTGPALAKDVESFGTLLQALAQASDLPKLTAALLPAAELQFYALVIGDDPASRTVWIRLTNVRRGLKPDRKLFTTLGDTLSKVEDPIFGFEDDLDLVSAGGTLAVLSQGAFKKLFRDNDALAAQIPGWISAITDHLPIVPAAEVILAEKCIKDSRARGKLEAISFRGHLPSVPPATIRKAMRDYGLDVTRFFNQQNKLDFKAEDVSDLLKVLNEDLFKGLLTDTKFRADRKELDS